MKNILLMAFFTALTLVLFSCRPHVFEEPLQNNDSQSDLSLLEGKWVGEFEGEKLHMVISQKSQPDLFEIKIKSSSPLFYSLLRVSRFKESYILNVDLSSITDGGVNILEGWDSRYILFGVHFDKGKLVLVPLDMDVFLEEFGKYYEIKLRKGNSDCVNSAVSLSQKLVCGRIFLDPNVLSLRASTGFYEDIMGSYNNIFPLDDAIYFNKQK